MAEHVYDSSDSCTGKSAVQEPLEYSIYGLLKKYQITITTAESATGGMIASTLINVPGISEFFTEGYVTYSNEAKVKMIHVAPETIDIYGVVSSETAADMAGKRTFHVKKMYRRNVCSVKNPYRKDILH